jgi:hypothetical protein
LLSYVCLNSYFTKNNGWYTRWLLISAIWI